MNSRERVLTALRHQEPDRIPIDFNGMASTGIMAIAYNRLVDHLGLPGGNIYLYDIGQQLATPEEAVLERFGVDVRPFGMSWYQNPLDPQWKPWTLPDGSPAWVPAEFNPVQNEAGDWEIINEAGIVTARMPADGYYFDGTYSPWAEISTVAEIEAIELPSIPDEALAAFRQKAKALYESTDKAIMGSFGGNILEAAQGLRGWEQFMVDMGAQPALAEAITQKLADRWAEQVTRYLDAVGEYIQIIQMGDDLGTQNGPQMSPRMYRKFIKPAHKKVYDQVKKHPSNPYIFLHCCGGIYPLIPDLIEEGVDILNPVQTSAKGMDPLRLKKEFGKDITFWGGGADTQQVLPNASPDEVRQHVRERIDIFGPGGGFVFNQIHNIQANVPPENVVAMFETALEYGGY